MTCSRFTSFIRSLTWYEYVNWLAVKEYFPWLSWHTTVRRSQLLPLIHGVRLFDTKKHRLLTHLFVNLQATTHKKQRLGHILSAVRISFHWFILRAPRRASRGAMKIYFYLFEVFVAYDRKETIQWNCDDREAFAALIQWYGGRAAYAQQCSPVTMIVCRFSGTSEWHNGYSASFGLYEGKSWCYLADEHNKKHTCVVDHAFASHELVHKCLHLDPQSIHLLTEHINRVANELIQGLALKL